MYVSNRLIKTVCARFLIYVLIFFVNEFYVYDAADKSSECVVDQIADLKCASTGDELNSFYQKREQKRNSRAFDNNVIIAFESVGKIHHQQYQQQSKHKRVSKKRRRFYFDFTLIDYSPVLPYSRKRFIYRFTTEQCSVKHHIAVCEQINEVSVLFVF